MRKVQIQQLTSVAANVTRIEAGVVALTICFVLDSQVAPCRRLANVVLLGLSTVIWPV